MRIGVVILHYNRIDLTAACCESLVSQLDRPARILVVDNGSTRHTPEELRAACPPGVECARVEKNIGFSAGCNVGLRQMLADPAVDAVLLLNNDTRCPPELTRRMAAALTPGVGLVGCEMTGAAEGETIAAGADFAPFFWFAVPARAGALPGYLQGACLLIPRSTLETVGLLDETFHFFCEDADYSLRVRAAGLRLAVAEGTRILHYGSSTIGTTGRLQSAWYRESSVVFLRKWRSFPLARALGPFLFRLASDALRGRREALRGNLEGWRSGWRRKVPKTRFRES